MMPKFYRQNRKRIDPRYFLNETTNRDLDEASYWDDDVDRARDEEERQFKAGEDNPWKQGSTLDSDELRAIADKMDQAQSGGAGGIDQKALSDELEDYRDRIGAHKLLDDEILGVVNQYIDDLWDGTVDEEEAMKISSDLKSGKLSADSFRFK